MRVLRLDEQTWEVHELAGKRWWVVHLNKSGEWVISTGVHMRSVLASGARGQQLIHAVREFNTSRTPQAAE